MLQIHKYVLDLKEVQKITCHSIINPLCAQMQGDNITIWAVVNTDTPLRQKNIFISGTGKNLDACISLIGYFGTVQHQGYVWHIFY